jgi:hypothetical protein
MVKVTCSPPDLALKKMANGRAKTSLLSSRRLNSLTPGSWIINPSWRHPRTLAPTQSAIGESSWTVLMTAIPKQVSLVKSVRCLVSLVVWDMDRNYPSLHFIFN